MRVNTLARFGLAITLAATALSTNAGAQSMPPRSAQPEFSAALARPTPEQAFARLPAVTQARLNVIADREPLVGGALSPATTSALAGLAGASGDVGTLTSIVLMLVARDAESDLQEMMDQMQARRDAAQNDCPPQNNAAASAAAAPARPAARTELEAARATALRAPSPVAPSDQRARPPRPTLPCLPDEMAALQVQQAMDRKSAAMSTLSNLLRRQSETSETITQNIR